MAFGKFADGASMFSTTPVENLFMLEFMPNAPGDFVRVYLYGLMQCYHPELAEGVEGVARALNMEPETVLNACRYWEREGLIVRQSDNPPMFVFHSCQEALNARPQIEKDYYENRDFTASLQNLFGADMLLHPKEYTMASDWVEVMKLPQEVVLCMVQHELESSSKKRTLQTIFKHLDKTAIELADHNIRTVEAAEAYLRRDEPVEQCAKALMKTFNFRRTPTEPELALVAKWLNEWHFAPEAVQEACRRTVNSGNPSFAYLDAILDKLRTPDGAPTDAEALRERAQADSEEFQKLKRILQELGQRNPTPTPQDRERFEAILQGGFEYEVVLAAARTGGKRSMEDLEKMLFKWAEQGLFTMEAYEQFRQKRAMMDQAVMQLFERAGVDRRPRQADRTLMEKWMAEHSMQMILLAGEQSVGTDTPMRYIDSILARWKKEGIATPEAAQAARPASSGAPRPNAPREAGQFAQREYTQADYARVYTDLGLDEDEEEST